MKSAGVRVGVKTRFLYDGEIVEILELHVADGITEAATRDLRSGRIRRIGLDELMYSNRSRLLSEDLVVQDVNDVDSVASLKWSAVSESARSEARQRGADVREVLTGYRSGSAVTAQPGEPRPLYVTTLPMGARVAAKAQELKVGIRTIERWVVRYKAEGEVGLLSARAVQQAVGSMKFELFEQAALDIMHEHTESSTPTREHVAAQARARLVTTYGVGNVPLPSQPTQYRILKRLNKSYALFSSSAKRIRDISARPVGPYGKLHPTRPGEYLLMDTTPSDVFAMDPHTLRWVSVDITVGMDWYSRCVTGLRVTPMSTKAIDAASVLYQSFRPPPAGRDWPAEAVWPPHGVPRSVLVEQEALDPASACAATPAIVPETLVVDHSRIFVGEHLTSACRQMGISVQPARIRIPYDKGPVERFFLTMRQGILQELPGYKGPDLYSRGVDPEREAFFFIDELEELLREWVATVYHRRPHDGVGEPGLWSLGLSPAQMFEHGIARAGYIEAPRDPCLAYHFLRVEWRTLQHDGVHIDKRTYRGVGLTGYEAGEKSPYRERGGRWPFHVDPDDVRFVYFFDRKNTKLWHALEWTEAAACQGPMNEDGLEFARDLARRQHPRFDDKLALAEMLGRRQLSPGRTPAERRAALRLSRQQSTLGIDVHAGASASGSPGPDLVLAGTDAVGSDISEAEGEGFVDELDEDPGLNNHHFYDDVLEET